MSPAMLTVFISLQMMGFTVQYYIFTLFITQLSGNKFVNAVIFGLTRAIAIFIFGAVMGKMSDMAVFRIVFVGAALSQVILIFFPNASDYLIYSANFLLISSLGGW